MELQGRSEQLQVSFCESAPEAQAVITISAVANFGLDAMKEQLFKLVAGSAGSPSEESVPLP